MSLVPLASFLDLARNDKQRSGSERMVGRKLNVLSQNPTFNEEKLFWLGTQR
jgi:hypothetical protein